MDISIIIVSFNAKKFLLKCLQSLTLHKSHYQTEIIVVDNASTDGSPETVKEGFPYVKLILNEKNLGFAKANNYGIRQSSGKYVCLINSDVILYNDCISLMYAYIDEHDNIGILGPKILNPDGTLQPSCRGFPSIWNSFCRALALDKLFPKSRLFGRQMMTFFPHDITRSVDILSGCFLMVRREAINQVGLLDENFFMYGEDKDWCKRFHEKGWQVIFLPDAKAVHYGGASSTNTPIKLYIEMQHANLKYWKKHHNLLAQLSFLFITFFYHMIRIAVNSILYCIKPKDSRLIVTKIKRSIVAIKWLLSF